MASVKYKYLFYIDDTQVYPVFGKGSSIKYEKEGEYVFKRIKLNGTFTLVNGKRKDFNLVWAKDLDHEFTFRMDYIVDGIVKESVNATFYKTDCTNWDEDNERVDVVLTTIDKYEKVMKALDKEFDLVKDLQPEKYKVKYKKEPLIQIAFPYHPVLYNRIGTSTYQKDIPVYTATELQSFGFITNDFGTGEMVYIPGTGDMTPDVSGIYIRSAATQYTRNDGVYRITRVEITRWTITEISSGDIVYRGPDGSSTMLDRDPFTQSELHTLESVVAPGTFCCIFPVVPYQRILTDAEAIGAIPTHPISLPDIGDYKFGYNNYIRQTYLPSLYMVVLPTNEHTTTATQFGRYDKDALHFADEYFNPNLTPYLLTRAYPLMQPSWKEYALVEFLTGGYGDEMIEAATTVELRDAYALADVIQLVFREVDSNINFEGSLFWSRFLFADTNPVSGDPKVTHFITPKSNILTPDYSQPDTGEKITIGRLNELMEAAQMMWWIDNNYNLRIEHISYFKNGRSYDDPYIGVDLTTMYEPRTGKPWSYHTNKYRYRKEEMPEEYVCKWQDECSEYFNGFPIKMISGFVEKGNIKTLNVSYFSSDLSLAMAFPENFSTEGYFVMAADYVGGEWEVPYEAFDILFYNDVNIQNGWWSFYYLHDKFWRHNLPCQDVIINNIQTTATTTKRGKEQKLVFPAQVHPDEMRLIKSGIGNCEIDGMEINLETRRVEITALGDNDFDNPCPTC